MAETHDQIREGSSICTPHGCSIITIGTYLPPSKEHHPLGRYVTPEQFEAYADYGKSLGVRHVFSAPLVRSSYQAGSFVQPGA